MKKKRRLRLPYYNYKTPGWYFITICTKNREWYFGEINNNVIILSDIGDIVKNYWFKITEHNENIQDYIFENPLNWENDIEFLKTYDNKEIQKYYKSIFKYKSILK